MSLKNQLTQPVVKLNLNITVSKLMLDEKAINLKISDQNDITCVVNHIVDLLMNV